MNWNPPERYIHVPTLEFVERNMVFPGIIKFRLLNEIILDTEWALNPMTGAGILIRERQREI